MKVEINHKEIEVSQPTTTLEQLLKEEGFNGTGQAVAINNRVVPRTEWSGFALSDGMKITIIRAVCGG